MIDAMQNSDDVQISQVQKVVDVLKSGNDEQVQCVQEVIDVLKEGSVSIQNVKGDSIAVRNA